MAHAKAWLGRPLLSECLDPETGELVPIAIVTDNGPAYKSAAFARYIAARPEFTHVRTRHRSPGTNGVIERFFQALKYQHLYRKEIEDGPMVAAAVERYGTLYDTVRGDRFPHPAHRLARLRRSAGAESPYAGKLSHFLDTGQRTPISTISE